MRLDRRRGGGRRLRRAAFGVGLAVAAAAGAAALIAVRGGGGDAEQPSAPRLTTAPVVQRDLAEYLEITGRLDYGASVALNTGSSGMLMSLAPEGDVVERGEQLYMVFNEPTAADAASVLARLESSHNSLLAARERLDEALSGPSEAAKASARASLADAREKWQRMTEPPSEADIAAAESAVLTASENLYELQNPSAADIASARSRLASAEQGLADLLAGPSRARVDAAEADLASAEQGLADLLAGPSRARVDAAEADLARAEQGLADLLAGPSRARVDAAEADLARAEQGLADLLAGPSQAEIDTAEAAVAVAKDAVEYGNLGTGSQLAVAEADLARAEKALADLWAGASQVEVDTARAAVLAAEDALADVRAGASQVEVDTARAAVLAAEDALADVRAGASQVEVDTARAAVLAAEDALADVRAGASQVEVDTARAAVLAAEDALDTLEDPPETALAAASVQLTSMRQALADVRAGASQVEVDTARAAVLAAEDALADLLAEPTLDELAALEHGLASAEAALVSAETDEAALGDVYTSRVVMYGDTMVHRAMSLGSEGEDVSQLQRNLAELGYGADGGFSGDGVFDEATEAAVRAWQEDTGRRVDAMVGPEDVMFVAGPVQIGAWAAGVEVGRELAAGARLADMSVVMAPVDGVMSTTQRVTAGLPMSDRDLVAEGIAVNVELPDGTGLSATVTAINPVPVLDAQTGENAVEVVIRLSEPASTVWIGASVDVEITETLVEGALVVPTTALLALVEGGYAVEVLQDDGSARLVGVETGLFVDGDVEVRSAQLAPGVAVVVPR